jgi:hypothetical protein
MLSTQEKLFACKLMKGQEIILIQSMHCYQTQPQVYAFKESTQLNCRPSLRRVRENLLQIHGGRKIPISSKVFSFPPTFNKMDAILQDNILTSDNKEAASNTYCNPHIYQQGFKWNQSHTFHLNFPHSFLQLWCRIFFHRTSSSSIPQ